MDHLLLARAGPGLGRGPGVPPAWPGHPAPPAALVDGAAVPTAYGVVWFKAGGPGCAFEARLLQALVAYDAPHVLRPLAVDVGRGWLLLPDGGIASTLQHDDLHDNNVLASFVFFDWGDACLDHPFASLLVTLRAVASGWLEELLEPDVF